MTFASGETSKTISIPILENHTGGNLAFTVAITAPQGVSLGANRSATVRISPNHGPAASAVQVSGTAVIGQTLTGSYTYSDEESDGQGASTFRWYRADNASGLNSTEIAGAEETTYVLAAADAGKHVSFEVTPVALAGASPGTAVKSDYTSAVQKADCATATGVTPVLLGKTDASVTLTAVAGYEYIAVDDGEALSTGTWQDNNVFTGLASSTAYDFYQRVKETATHYASAVSAKLDVTTDAAVLAGTATITGDAVFGETLTASLSGGNNTGTLSYQWVRGGTDIPSATESEYTLQEADIGLQITVKITSSVETGTRTSAPTSAVQKADCATATGIAPVLSGKTDTSVTLTAVAGYEYIIVDDGEALSTGTWQDSNVFAGLTSITAYDFYQRVKETATHYPSAVSAKLDVTTNAEALTGTATITGAAVYGQTLTASLSGGNNTGTLAYQWARGGTDIPSATASEYTLEEADIGLQITVKILSSVQSGTRTSAATPAVQKADCATATGIAPVLLGRTDTGVTLEIVAGYEYIVVGDGGALSTGTWQDSNEFTGFASSTAYDFYQRVKETATHYASAVSSKLDVTTDAAVLAGTAAITGEAVFGETLTASLSGGNNTGTLTYQWARGGTDIPSATAGTYTLEEADIGQLITVTIGSTVETGTRTSAATEAVQKADAEAAAAPELAGKTQTSITAKTVAGYEYILVGDGNALSTGTWQGSNVFTGLSANTAYDLYQRVKETATHNASAVSPKLDVTTDAAVLTGTATISGAAVFGQTLTASLSGSNNTGTLAYQWARGGTDIPSATASAYALQAADIGRQITVKITSTVETGTRTSAATAVVQKADAAVAAAPELAGKTQTRITLKPVAGYEYIIVDDGETLSAGIWQDENVFTDLVSDTAYDVYQRVKETATHKASAVSPKLNVTTSPEPDGDGDPEPTAEETAEPTPEPTETLEPTQSPAASPANPPSAAPSDTPEATTDPSEAPAQTATATPAAEATPGATIRTIKGRLLDPDGNPLAGYVVELHSNPLTTVTDKDGRYEFRDVEYTGHEMIVKTPAGDEVAEFELIFSEGDEFSTDVTEEGVSITYTSRTATVDIEIALTADRSTAAIAQVSGSEKPHGGDTAGGIGPVLLWAGLVAIAVMIAVVIVLLLRKKKEENG